MKTKLVFLLALSVGVLGKLAVAQSAEAYPTPQVQYAVFHPSEGNAALKTVAWGRDRDRGDRDHDRDDQGWRRRDRDRNDRWRWRERRYPSATANNDWWRNGNWRNNNGYWGRNNGWYGNNSGWYGNTANNGRRGEYNRNGDFHPFGSNGYYDRNGRWHNGGGWWR